MAGWDAQTCPGERIAPIQDEMIFSGGKKQ
jgi:hypothetical protein